MQVTDGALSDPPVEAARIFRAALRAMARPGTIETVTGAAPPAPLSPAAGALVLTLCDPDTAVHLAGAHDASAVADWITFHTGAPLVAPERADFALGTWDAMMPISAYRRGTPAYPDRSATLIVEMDELSATGTRLTGPGIETEARLSLPDAAVLRENARGFPLGLDFFLVAGRRLAALPRSTRIAEAG